MKCPNCNTTFERSAPLLHFQVPCVGWPGKFTSLCGASFSEKTTNKKLVDCPTCVSRLPELPKEDKSDKKKKD